LRRWLADGCHGSMIWMAEREGHRGSPGGLWPEVRSVISLGMSYAPKGDPLALADVPSRGRISVYAQGGDYHDVVKRQLKTLGRWLAGAGGGDLKVFVDTAPVMEKPLAEAAGVGWQGKHTNLVSRDHGSWLFLGAIYTTLALATDRPGRDSCGSCDACQRACPTDAFPAPYRLDARRCISYLTIEHKGAIPVEFREGIGNRIYGCDDCLAVCPWNKFAVAAGANRAFRRERSSPRPRSATCSTSTMQDSARCSPDRRSSGSGAIGWSGTRRSRRGTAGTRPWCRDWRGCSTTMTTRCGMRRGGPWPG